MIKKIFFLFVISVLPSRVFAETVLKIGTLAPVGTEWYDLLDKIAKRIKKETGGKVKIVIYPGGVMGDEGEMIRKIRIGQLHGGAFTTYGIKKIAPALGVMDLPLLFRNYGEIDKIITKFRAEFEGYFRKSEFKLLVLAEQGIGYFFTKKENVSGFRDIAKTRIWGWKGENTILRTIKAIGTSPIYVAVPDVLAALETGMIETFDVSPLGCLGLQWCKAVKTMIDYPLRYELGVVVIHQKFWNEIPDDLKGVIEKVFREEEKVYIPQIREANEKAKKKIRELGVKFIKPKDVKWFEERVKKEVWFASDTEYSHELLKRILRELGRI